MMTIYKETWKVRDGMGDKTKGRRNVGPRNNVEDRKRVCERDCYCTLFV